MLQKKGKTQIVSYSTRISCVIMQSTQYAYNTRIYRLMSRMVQPCAGPLNTAMGQCNNDTLQSMLSFKSKVKETPPVFMHPASALVQHLKASRIVEQTVPAVTPFSGTGT
jgi:hypothetical protein